MTLPAETQKALATVIAAGAQDCAGRLREITYHEWSADGVRLILDEAAPLAGMLASTASDHYGVHLTFPGGSFLILCTGKSGYLIATAFTRDVQDRVENMQKREAYALGEVSNIMLNPMIEHLAKAAGKTLIVSSPKTELASQRDHLAKALARYREGVPLASTFFVKLSSSRLFSECLLLIFLDKSLVEMVSERSGG